MFTTDQIRQYEMAKMVNVNPTILATFLTGNGISVLKKIGENGQRYTCVLSISLKTSFTIDIDIYEFYYYYTENSRL
jgi:hypothetical protein